MSDVNDIDAITAGFDGIESVTTDEVTTLDTESLDAPEDDSTEEVEAEDTEEQDDESPASEESDSEEAEVESPESSDDEDSADRKEAARQAYLAREARRREQEAKVTEELNEYVEGEDDDPIQQKLRELEVEQYRNRVENNTNKLSNSYEKATADIELFRNPSPEIAEALGEAIDEFQARHVSVDRYGNPVEVTGDLYQFLQTKAGLIQRLTQVGARSELVAKAKTAANVTPQPAKAAPKPKEDPLMEGFDSYR
ncbi:MAG: hypothetical protein JWN75_1115 [Candidatus Saccharibacteria bacterium]|nr:hypothetical protein [Candidatus Saccharibacteria bacterium]